MYGRNGEPGAAPGAQIDTAGPLCYRGARRGEERLSGLSSMRTASVASRWLDAMLVVLASATLIGTIRVALTLDLPLAWGTEGWNAYHAAQAAAGQNPYPPPSGLFYDNYPPLGFYIVGLLSTLTGDALVAGRAVSLLAFLTIGLGVAAAARLMGCERREAAFAALLFSTILLFDYTYVGMNDPQLLGQAIQIGGLVLVLRERRTDASMLLAALLFVAGFFTKHSLVIQPLAAGVWLLVYDRRNGIRLAAFGLLLLLFGMIGFRFAFGTSLWSQLDSARVWLLQYSLHAMGARSQAGLVPLAASLALLRWFRRDTHVVLCVAYLAASLVCAAYFLGGAGVGSKALYDAVIALSLCGGVGANRLANLRLKGAPLRPLYAACHFVPVVAMLIYHPLTGTLPPHWWSRSSPPLVDTTRDVAFLKVREGRALCYQLTLCYWSGKPAEIDVWGYIQAVTVGARDGRELHEAIARRRYAVLQLQAAPDIWGPRPEVDAAYVRGLNRLIEANYRLDHTSANGTFWVPKSR